MIAKARLSAARVVKIVLAALPLCLAGLILANVHRYESVQGKWELIELRGKSGEQILVKPAPPQTGFRIIANWIKPYGWGSEEWGLGALLILHGDPKAQCCEAHILSPHTLGCFAAIPALLDFENDKLLIATCGGQHPRSLDLRNAPDGTRIWVLRRER